MKPNALIPKPWIPRTTTLLALIALASPASTFAQAAPPPAQKDKDKPEEEVTQLEEFVVQDSLQGQARAIDGTKNAINLVNIVSADKMGTFPDLNAAEAVRRLPGVGVVLSGGEGRFITIRGAAPNYNGTLLNGFSMPSGDSDLRRNDLQTISNSLIDTIVVTKAALPDMPAQGIGGMTNIILRSPLQLKGREVTVSTYFGDNEYGGTQDREDVTYGDFIDKKHRFAFQISANHRRSDSYFDETQVFDPTSYTVNGQPVGLTSQIRYQLTETVRRNKGFDLTLAGKFGAGTELVLRGFDADQAQAQVVHRYTFSGIAPFLVGGVPLELTHATGLVNGRIQRLWRDRTWNLEIKGWQLTGKTDLGHETKLTYGFSSMRSFERYKNDYYANAVRVNSFGGPLRITVSNDMVKLAPTDAASTAIFRDPSTQRIANITIAPLRNDWESEKTPYVDALHKFIMDGGSSFEVKSGLYFRYRDKSNPNLAYTVTQLASGTLTFANLGSSGNFANFDRKGVDLGVKPDPAVGSALYANNLAVFGPLTPAIAPGDSNNFFASEDIYAGYVMGTYIKDRLTLIGGLRYEKTKEGFSRLTTGSGAAFKHFDSDYNHSLPSVHAKYALMKNMFLRASWANTVGRPDAINIYGLETRDDINLTINQPNPGLKPLTSENLDISLDWYMGQLGQFMVGAFSKDIKNFPLSTTDLVTINGNVYRRTSVQPNSNGKINGWEASFRRSFDFLPGAFRGLGVDVNYAGISSELDTPTRPDHLPLVNQPDHIFNASVYYGLGKFFARVAMAEQGKQIVEVYVPGLDGTSRTRRQWDFTASYEFGKTHTFQVYVEWRNITNAPDIASWGPASNLDYRNTYGSNIGGGVRMRF